MCTALTFRADNFYFGRNLDLSYHYNEAVAVTPRNFPFRFRNGETNGNHFAIIGMATVEEEYPLYYDATNEKGLSIAGLNFPDNAVYNLESESAVNVAPFELIPYILGKCSTADEAYSEIKKLNLWDIPFSDNYPLTSLHWIVADKKRCFTVEPMKDGLEIYENPVGVLTNNPPFDYHMYNLANYLNLSVDEPADNPKNHTIKRCSLGLGAHGLPGDLSSASRFVRATFAKIHSECSDDEYENVNQFFHILGFTEQAKGFCRLPDGKSHYTVYTSCCNTDRGIYYYITYDGRQISCVDMKKEDLNSEKIAVYPLKIEKSFFEQN